MLSNNVPTTFSVRESDFLFASRRSGSNVNAHLMHSLMKDRVSLQKLKWVIDKLVSGKLSPRKIAPLPPQLGLGFGFEEVPLRQCLQTAATVVAYLVANNTFSNNFK